MDCFEVILYKKKITYQIVKKWVGLRDLLNALWYVELEASAILVVVMGVIVNV
jgi:hypothetical protein